MQTTAEAVALCEKCNHPNLGIVFNGYHWYATQEKELEKRVNAVMPWLHQVNIADTRLSPLGWGGVATMEPIDRGELVNFAVVAALKRTGYDGRIGILGWDYCGDAYLKLQRCLVGMREIDRRLEQQPSWANIEPGR